MQRLSYGKDCWRCEFKKPFVGQPSVQHYWKATQDKGVYSKPVWDAEILFIMLYAEVITHYFFYEDLQTFLRALLHLTNLENCISLDSYMIHNYWKFWKFYWKWCFWLLFCSVFRHVIVDWILRLPKLSNNCLSTIYAMNLLAERNKKIDKLRPGRIYQ